MVTKKELLVQVEELEESNRILRRNYRDAETETAKAWGEVKKSNDELVKVYERERKVLLNIISASHGEVLKSTSHEGKEIEVMAYPELDEKRYDSRPMGVIYNDPRGNR